MKNKLEQLLNSLLEKGWKPFGDSRIDEINRAEQYAGNWNWCCGGSKDAVQKRKSTRQIVSKESGLWRFVCENKLVKPQVYAWYFYREGMGKEVCKEDYEFRLIESALCDEDKLEEFLLSNIKVEGE